jgi:hypothetical protein
MDKDAVDDSFAIRSFNSTVIALDGGIITGNTATPFSPTLDSDAYDIDWNSDNTEATFTFAETEDLDVDVDYLYSDFVITRDPDWLTKWNPESTQNLDPEGNSIMDQLESNVVDDTIPASPDLAESAQPNPEPETDSSFATALAIIEIINRLEEDRAVAASRATDVETAGFPRFEPGGSFNQEPDLTIFEDGFESGNLSTWSR